MARGPLVLVVGPSGAGKDSIIAGAAERLHGDARIVFARRAITRPADTGGEDHVALSPTEFAALQARGGLLLAWRAHGLDYGLPVELAGALDAGKCVVANVSRTVVTEARRRLAPVVVAAIAATSETRASRLARRGREDAAGVADRLNRSNILSPADIDVVIDNDGPLDAALDKFLAVLRRVVDQPVSL